MLSLERRDCFQIEAARLPMRDEIEDRLAVPGNHDGLAALDLSGQGGEAVLRLFYRYRAHVTNVATNGYFGNRRAAAHGHRRQPWQNDKTKYR